jgi:hypothetical protein
MLNKPNDKQIASLARICRSPEGVDILGYMEDGLKRYHELLLNASGENLLRTQGAAKELKEFIDLMRDAPNLVEKARNAPGR